VLTLVDGRAHLAIDVASPTVDIMNVSDAVPWEDEVWVTLSG
jgi:hypothetical protein